MILRTLKKVGAKFEVLQPFQLAQLRRDHTTQPIVG